MLSFIYSMDNGEFGSSFMENFFALHDIRSTFFKPHQIVTYMFLHGGFWHIALNMLILWMFG